MQDLLSILKNEVHNRKNKNVEVLQLAENITRRINGNFITQVYLGLSVNVRKLSYVDLTFSIIL